MNQTVSAPCTKCKKKHEMILKFINAPQLVVITLNNSQVTINNNIHIPIENEQSKKLNL
jgi:hypothetical protein